MLRTRFTLPEHPLIQHEAPAKTERMVLRDFGVNKPKPFCFTTHPSRIRLLLTRRERWIFDNRGVILALITTGWDLNFFSVVIRTHISNLEWGGLLKAHPRKTPRRQWGWNLHSKDCESGFWPSELSWPPNLFTLMRLNDERLRSNRTHFIKTNSADFGSCGC